MSCLNFELRLQLKRCPSGVTSNMGGFDRFFHWIAWGFLCLPAFWSDYDTAAHVLAQYSCHSHTRTSWAFQNKSPKLFPTESTEKYPYKWEKWMNCLHFNDTNIVADRHRCEGRPTLLAALMLVLFLLELRLFDA